MQANRRNNKRAAFPARRQSNSKAFIFFALISLCAVGYYLWSARKAAEAKTAKAELDLGLEAARMVGAKFEKAAAVKVGVIKGTVVAKAEFKGRIFTPTQESLFPVTVDYFINLDRMGKEAYHWNARNGTLTIDMPDVTVAKPNIDEGAAIIRQHGSFISREAALAMARQVSVRAEAKSRAFAYDPKNMTKARENARTVVTNLALQPLKAAGMTNVRVAVSFPWEPKTYLNQPSQQWDRSRRPEEVIEGR
ncbi:DUF4230 domain-containing protein [Sphingomonas sp. Leaf20]|uniref:DUF4230 domain-containing protein n=1 Tax=Sphingomonas sp. Leaf20 TaxID=1735685 RepID=UPI0006FF689D|nr:DUF4230 domain-containing protein [Sphingomonas sp. Leaf20]KQM71691.1 hypothetical protein ASE72_09215 [Sphingomonas sp. Leaf20]